MIWAQLEWTRTKKSAPLDTQSVVGGRSSWCCPSTLGIRMPVACYFLDACIASQTILGFIITSAGTCKRWIYATKSLFWRITLLMMLLGGNKIAASVISWQTQESMQLLACTALLWCIRYATFIMQRGDWTLLCHVSLSITRLFVQKCCFRLSHQFILGPS